LLCVSNPVHEILEGRSIMANDVKLAKTLADIETVWDNFKKAMENVEGVDRYELSITLKNRAIKNGSYARLVLDSMKRKN